MKYLLLTILLLLSGCSMPFGGSDLKEVKPIISSYEYKAFFKSNIDGSIIERQMTKSEYEALGVKNAVNPTIEGYTFISAYGGKPVYTNPVLRDNEYIVLEKPTATSTGKILIKLPGQAEKIQ